MFFKVTSQDWLNQVLITVGIFAVFFSVIFSLLTAEIVIDPSYKQTQTAVSNALQELELANAKVQQEKAQDEVLLNNIGDAVVAVDCDRKVIFINEVAAKMIGWKREEVVGKVWGVDMPGVVDDQGNSIPREKRSIHQAMTKRASTFVSFYSYIRKDGTRFPVANMSAPIITNGQVTGAIVVFRDVTREKEIDRMKTEFISLASHQLRTPLSAIKWYLRMLLDGDAGKLSKEQEDFVRIVDESNERMISLVNDLLNISRIESGRIIIEPHPTDISTLVQDSINELSMKMHEKELVFTVNIQPDMPLVNIDVQLIRHVYMNLLSNAIKYTPLRGTITLKIYRRGDEIVSEIQDTGYGIPKGQQNKVFQKFFRAENAVKYETDGTGLGLYLVKAIIDSSGGKIWFRSPTIQSPTGEGTGTTFWFALPIEGVNPKKGEVSLDS
jgi:PAS domain S-box-containing protein